MSDSTRKRRLAWMCHASHDAPIEGSRRRQSAHSLADEDSADCRRRLRENRMPELILLICFLVVIAGVPVTQTCIELARHERVQATDVFRYEPTAKNLRQFEHTLEEKSWFQQHLRPQLQRLLFATLHDTGAKGVLGRDRWLFYRPDLRYLVDPDRVEAGP